MKTNVKHTAKRIDSLTVNYRDVYIHLNEEVNAGYATRYYFSKSSVTSVRNATGYAHTLKEAKYKIDKLIGDL